MQANGKDTKATEKPKRKERALIGIADSAILFLTAYIKKTARESTTGQLVVVREPVSIPVKLAQAPIGGYTAGGGCAFNITERWCRKNKLDFEEVIETIMEAEAYGLRYVFEDDERIDPSTNLPYYRRVLDQIKHRHETEKRVQNEAYEVNALNSDSVIA
jgi:hypothetical protein